MDTTEIGDLLLSPDGTRLRLTIAEQQPTTTLTLRGVRAVMDYLQTWIAEQEVERHITMD